jgi:hypothetical protein
MKKAEKLHGQSKIHVRDHFSLKFYFVDFLVSKLGYGRESS